MAVTGQDPIIIVEGLTARFGEDTILEGVNLEVFPGEIFVIIGESGCGKTVLMKHMIGLFTPCEGRVLTKGIDLARASDEERHRLRMEIGVLFQSGALQQPDPLVRSERFHIGAQILACPGDHIRRRGYLSPG